MEQNKKLEEKSKNLIKETKIIENNYILSIEIYKKYITNIKDLSNQTINVNKSALYDMSKNYKNNLFEILILFKVCFQAPLNTLILNLEKIDKFKEKETIDELLDNIYNKNISLINIFPKKYKLKIFNLLNNNNDNIFSMSFFDNEDIEKNDKKEDELTEISLKLIKIMYKNFKLLSNYKIDIQLEEEKLKTNKLSQKLFSDIISFNGKNKGNSIQFFTEEDFKQLENLLDKKINRLIIITN